jgi:hypothetical protein
MVLNRRERLNTLRRQLEDDGSLSQDDLDWLEQPADILRIADSDAQPIENVTAAQLKNYIDEALYRFDTIPAGLALG